MHNIVKTVHVLCPRTVTLEVRLPATSQTQLQKMTKTQINNQINQ